MNNDLISRSALKENIDFEYICKCCHNVCGSFCQISEIVNKIDNAPAVEPFEPDYVGAERLKARQRGYEEGYRYGMEIGKTLNPKIKQGEWLEYNATGKKQYKCSECGMKEKKSKNCSLLLLVRCENERRCEMTEDNHEVVNLKEVVIITEVIGG